MANPAFVLSSVATCLVLQLHGAEYHVAMTGADVNPGTADRPWRTIRKAASAVAAGDIVSIRAGTYSERVSLSNKKGTAVSPIVFRKYPGDEGAAIITQEGVTPPDGMSAIFKIRNCDHIILRGLEIAGYRTSGSDAKQRAQLPVGIHISGGGKGIRIRSCKVHHIWQSSKTLNNYDANAFGIAVYGDAAEPIDRLVIDRCEVHSLRTGASESVVLNGNVTNFRVTNNIVRDCNNIGIDFIGFEGGNPDPALDQARNGVCSGNRVFRIDSRYNPVYGGNFTTGGGNDTRSAPGIYVDGGRDILIERNHVHDCNYALSAGSEHPGKLVRNVTVRNNIFHHCHVGGIVIGGSNAGQDGGVTRSFFTNNTIYQNDTAERGGGQFSLQNHVTDIVIRRNIMATTADFAQFIVWNEKTGNISPGAIDWNLYKSARGAGFEFIWKGSAKSSFGAWKKVSGDQNSIFTRGSLGLATSTPVVGTPATGFALLPASPARNAGDRKFKPARGEKDYFGQSRVSGGRVDIGADEYMAPRQAWEDFWASFPDEVGGYFPPLDEAMEASPEFGSFE